MILRRWRRCPARHVDRGPLAPAQTLGMPLRTPRPVAVGVVAAALPTIAVAPVRLDTTTTFVHMFLRRCTHPTAWHVDGGRLAPTQTLGMLFRALRPVTVGVAAITLPTIAAAPVRKNTIMKFVHMFLRRCNRRPVRYVDRGHLAPAHTLSIPLRAPGPVGVGVVAAALLTIAVAPVRLDTTTTFVHIFLRRCSRPTAPHVDGGRLTPT